MNETTLHVRTHKQEFIALLLCVAAVFLGLSLYSYNPFDASWFFYSSESHEIANWCGSVGAHVAALLFYLCGGASLLFVPLIAYCAYVVFYGYSFKPEWERFVAFAFFMITCAAFSHLYQFDLLPTPFYGGYFGYGLCSVLYYFFDYVGTSLFLYTAWAISFVVMTRLSFVGIARYAISAVQITYAFLRDYKVPQKIYRGFIVGCYYASRPFVWGAYHIKRLLDGTALEDTNLFGSHEDELQLETQQQLNLEDTHHHYAQDHNDVFEYDELNNEDSYDAPVVDQEESQPFHYDDEQPVGHQTQPAQQIGTIKTRLNKQAIKPIVLKEYRLPRASIFVGVKEERDDEAIHEALQQRAKTLEEKLERFGVTGEVVSIKRGPVVTLFEYEPSIDTKISKILSLEDDLALALQAMSIRILAPIPGRSVVGFEVANKKRKDVHLAKIVQAEKYRRFSGSLPLVLGQDTIGNEVIVDLIRMPHLLIAGSTGSGKSVALNTMLMSLLCKCTPDQLKLILIDPKRLEFASYADIAHLLFPIVTDPRKAAPILRWVVHQMEERYEMMSHMGVRNLDDYNKECAQNGYEPLPYIVVVIDELADLMMTAGRDIEDLIARITQMARAAGIHMIVATQRPSVDVITGLIKVNFPSRVSFRVTSKVDSRTILDCGGADKLLGRGDMLFLDSTNSTLQRVHGAYVSDKEIEQVVEHIKAERQVEYLDIAEQLATGSEDLQNGDDELYEKVVCFLDEVDDVSISLLQRKFRIGYNRSARIIDLLESRGKIMPADGGKTRKVVR